MRWVGLSERIRKKRGAQKKVRHSPEKRPRLLREQQKGKYTCMGLGSSEETHSSSVSVLTVYTVLEALSSYISKNW